MGGVEISKNSLNNLSTSLELSNTYSSIANSLQTIAPIGCDSLVSNLAPL